MPETVLCLKPRARLTSTSVSQTSEFVRRDQSHHVAAYECCMQQGAEPQTVQPLPLAPLSLMHSNVMWAGSFRESNPARVYTQRYPVQARDGRATLAYCHGVTRMIMTTMIANRNDDCCDGKMVTVNGISSRVDVDNCNDIGNANCNHDDRLKRSRK